MERSSLILLVQVISVCELMSSVSTNVLPEPGCHFVQLSGPFYRTKEVQNEWEAKEITKERDVQVKEKCQKLCQSDCKGFALEGMVGAKTFDVCFTFTEDLEHLISQKQLIPYSNEDDVDDVLHVYNRKCEDEVKIGGGDGNGGDDGNGGGRMAVSLWTAITTTIPLFVLRYL